MHVGGGPGAASNMRSDWEQFAMSDVLARDVQDEKQSRVLSQAAIMQRTC